MNSTVSLAAAAVGLAALLGVSGSAYMDLHNQLNSNENRVATLVSERDNLNEQVKTLQQQLTESNRKNGTIQTDLDRSKTAMKTSQEQVKTLSACLTGVVQGMNELSEGNNAAAFFTFSSVRKDCQQAGTIIQQQNSTSSPQAQPPATTGTIY